MSYGQYSDNSFGRITKAEQLRALSAQHYTPVTSKRAGNNRLFFTTPDGCQHFMLHKTVIASLDPKTSILTLDDGGWATKTTRAAWHDAFKAFGREGYASIGSAASTHDRDHSVAGIRFDRTTRLTWPELRAA